MENITSSWKWYQLLFNYWWTTEGQKAFNLCCFLWNLNLWYIKVYKILQKNLETWFRKVIQIIAMQVMYWFNCFSVGTSSSGRARSDPTHQHHSHLHVHSHSAHHGGGTQFPTMECESPAGSQVGSTAGGTRSQYQQQQSWPPEASQGQSSGHHGNSAVSSHVHLSGHRHHSSHHHHVVTAQSPPSVNASVPPNLVGPPQGVLLSGPVLTSSEQVVYGTRTGFPTSGMSVDMVQAGHHSHPSIDPSLNMQLPSYPQQYGQYNQQTWSGTGFPFALTSSSGGTEPPPGHARTVTERSDDSPMVGVIVQQSPVVIHWW